MSNEVKKGRGVTYMDLDMLPDMLRKGLFLPDTFEIVEVQPASFNRLALYLESVCIPVTKENQPTPEVSLYYVKIDDRVFLDRVELSGYGYIEAKLVKTPDSVGTIYAREEVSV